MGCGIAVLRPALLSGTKPDAGIPKNFYKPKAGCYFLYSGKGLMTVPAINP
jgi:hypothetical protein